MQNTHPEAGVLGEAGKKHKKRRATQLTERKPVSCLEAVVSVLFV